MKKSAKPYFWYGKSVFGFIQRFYGLSVGYGTAIEYFCYRS